MSVKVSRQNVYFILSIKLMYYYGKMFGMVCFSMTDDFRLKSSFNSQIYSILYRLTCLIGVTLLVPEIVDDLSRIQSLPFQIMAYIQYSSVIIFTVTFMTIQVIQHSQFASVINRAIDIFIQISAITNDSRVFGNEFFFMILSRAASNVTELVVDIPRFITVEKKNIFFIFQCILGYILWFGTFVVIDFLCFGYIVASAMYRNIGNHMVSFAKRVQRSETQLMTKYQRMRTLCDFSDELDQCSMIYSKLFKLTLEFNALFKFNILFTFYMSLCMIVGNIHYVYLNFIKSGDILWLELAVGVIRIVEFMFLMLVIDLTIRRSKMPKYVNWDSLCSDIDIRWDRSVDQFLSQQRFEDLKIDVYGLFELNNGLCLKGLSVIVAYLTILIQFSLLGYI